jgi:peptide/nickel transport system permease protein
MKYLKFMLGRVFACALVIWLGVTIMALVPVIRGDRAYSLTVPEYVDYLKAVVHMDFGLSKFYKTEIGPLVWRYMPYTMGLCITANLVAWVIGNAIGLMAGIARGKALSRVFEWLAMAVYPIPYFILAVVVQMIFAYVLRLFPLTSEIMTGRGLAVFLRSLLRSSALPAVTMIASALGWWTLSMSSLAGAAAGEDYAQFAHLRGIPKSKIARRYIRPNCMLPQVTALAIQLGAAFGGALMTEMVFGYPGVGFLMQRAAFNNDYNLLFGASVISIVAIAVATTIVDLIYPLVDPRVRLR